MVTVELAERLLERLGIHSPPVDVGAVAHSCNVGVVHVTEAGWDSALDVGTRTLYLTAGLTATGRRFAVAHGVGHYLLHRDRARAFRERFEGHGDVLDMEANLFALNLLVPWNWAAAYRLFETCDRVAERFGVTRALVEAQLRAHGIPA